MYANIDSPRLEQCFELTNLVSALNVRHLQLDLNSDSIFSFVLPKHIKSMSFELDDNSRSILRGQNDKFILATEFV